MALKPHLLLVEDDVDLHDSLKVCLEMEGHKVDSAFNGREALAFLQALPAPSKVILDLMMPVMNGYELLAQLDREHKLSEISIILLSAAEDGRRTAEKYGLKFLPKPPSLDLLFEYCAEA